MQLKQSKRTLCGRSFLMLRQRIRIVTTVLGMVGIDNMSHKYQTITANNAASNFLHCCHASRTISLLFTVKSTFRTDLYLVPPYFTVEVVWNDLRRVTFSRLNSTSLIFCGWTFCNLEWTWDLNITSAFYELDISTSRHWSLEGSYPTYKYNTYRL
jgi:hypothetical protein